MSARRRAGAGVTAMAMTAGLATVLAGCSGGATTSSKPSAGPTTGVTIKVAMFQAPPPKAAMSEFTKKTGITVDWSVIDWDSLQTKIAAAATSNTYFADATDVDWSRVGQEGKLGWFYPMEDFLDTKTMAQDMPQLASFTYHGKVVGIPYDASFMVTTVNKDLFAKAGITTMPTTMAEYTDDLTKIKKAGVAANPLNIPFSAAEGLSTYWYQTTMAFGGTILNAKGEPQFTSPDSAGYKAAQWMIDAMKTGLVPSGSINVADTEGQEKLMAKGVTASTFSDYSGNVGSMYNVPSISSVVGKVAYLATPGVDGPTVNLSNPDGIGIPKTAKYAAAAAKFIDWYTQSGNQAAFAGVEGPSKVEPGYFMPSRLSAVEALNKSGKLNGGDQLTAMLKTSKPVFPQGAPSWYPQFSNAVYTNLHAAAAGSMSVSAAIKAIAAQAKQLASNNGA